MADEIREDLEDDPSDSDSYSDNDFENCDPEEKSIKQLRREEMRKNVQEKDEKRVTSYLSQRAQMSALELML